MYGNKHGEPDFSSTLHSICEFTIPKQVKDVCLLEGNKIAVLCDSNRSVIDMYTGGGHQVTPLSFGFSINVLASSSDQHNRLVFANEYSIFRASTDGNAGASQPSIYPCDNAISMHVLDHQIAIQTPQGIIIFNGDTNNGSCRLENFSKAINNINASYVMALVSENVMLFGHEDTLYIMDYKNNVLVPYYELPGSIQAITRLGDNYFAVAFEKLPQARGLIRNRTVATELDQSPISAKHTSTHTCRSFIWICKLVHPMEIVQVKQWESQNQIKFLAATYSGDRLITGFEGYSKQDHPEHFSDFNKAGDLEMHNQLSQRIHTTFEVYKFGVSF